MRHAAHYRIDWKFCAFCSVAIWLVSFGPAISAFAAEATATDPFAEAAPPAAELAAKDAHKVSPVATHRQAAIIQINVDGQQKAKVSCFCLTPDDRILAGCAGPSGEIRVFDREGKYLETWSVPIKPDAIFARADGTIFLSGEGQVAKLSPKGTVELKKASPHAAALNEHPEKLREEVIAQAKQQVERFAQQAKQFDQMVDRADKEIVSLKDQIAALDKDDDGSAKADDSPKEGDHPAAARRTASPVRIANNKQLLERRIAMFERQKDQYKQMKTQFANMSGVDQSGKLSEEQIDQRVKSSMAYKLKAASISATKNDVFLATPSPAGYGFGIWRMDDQFANSAQIVTGLSGCCGQMDVKANDQGVFVAENSRHHVVRYDRAGKKLGEWGFSARDGLDGFGSCCNPMNVAFGPGDAVYTAEDDTGRIKRYSPEGKLLGLVGLVELKPGCKNVSIAVSSDGSRVYMLDINRNHLVRMDARPADEVAKEAANTPKITPRSSDQPASGFGQVIRAIFSSGD